MFTQGAQTYDVEEEEELEVLVLTKEGGANLSQTLDNQNPPKVDKKKVGYVIRGSNKRKASNNKIPILKKKGRSWGRIQKTLMFKLRKNGRLMKNSLTMNKRIVQRTKMCSHRSTHVSSIHQ